jgi:hypothetical protein
MDTEEIAIMRAIEESRRTHRLEEEARARVLAEAHTSRGVAVTEQMGADEGPEALAGVEEVAAQSDNHTAGAMATNLIEATVSQQSSYHLIRGNGPEDKYLPNPVSLLVQVCKPKLIIAIKKQESFDTTPFS